MLLQSTGSSILTVFVSSENNIATERRFDKQLTIPQLKGKLEPITGIPVDTQRIKLYNGNVLVTNIEGENVMLGAYPVENFMTLHVENTGTKCVQNQFTDLSLVQKYEMKEDKYDQLKDSVREFKRRNKLGRFNDSGSTIDSEEDSEPKYEELIKKMKVGDRCEVDLGGEDKVQRRGTLMFLGKTEFKPGTWVGIQYDEPLGKHNGTVNGKSYFSCRPKHGSFVRPDHVAVGNFPEDDPFADVDEI